MKALGLFLTAWEQAVAGRTVVLLSTSLAASRDLHDRFLILFIDDPRVHRLRFSQIGVAGGGKIMFRSVSTSLQGIPKNAILLNADRS